MQEQSRAGLSQVGVHPIGMIRKEKSIEMHSFQQIKLTIALQMQRITSIYNLQPSILTPSVQSSPQHSRTDSLQLSNPFAINNQTSSDHLESSNAIDNLALDESMKEDKMQQPQTVDKFQIGRMIMLQHLKQLQNIITWLQVKREDFDVLKEQKRMLQQKLADVEQSQNRFKQKCEAAINVYSKQLNKQKMKLKQQIQQLQNNIRHLQTKQPRQNHQQLQAQIQLLQQQLKQKDMIINHNKKWSQQNYKQVEGKLNKQMWVSAELNELNLQQEKTIRQLSVQNTKLSNQLTQIKQTALLQLTKKQQQKGTEATNSTSQTENKYMREENEYLRNQIIHFNNMKKELQDKLTLLTQKYGKLKQELKMRMRQREEMQKLVGEMKRKHEEQKLKFQTSHVGLIEQLASELHQLKTELNHHLSNKSIDHQQLQQMQQAHQQQISHLTSADNQLRTQISSLQTQMQQIILNHQQQTNLFSNYKQIYQLEINQFEEASLLANRQMQQEMEGLRERYQQNWNRINEQLMQQKYRNKQLKQKIESMSLKQHQLQSNKTQLQLLHRQLQLYTKTEQLASKFNTTKEVGSKLNGMTVKDMRYGMLQYFLIKIRQQNEQLKQEMNGFKLELKASLGNMHSLMQTYVINFHQQSYRQIMALTTHKQRFEQLQKETEQMNNTTNHQSPPVINIDLVNYQQHKSPTANIKNIKKTLKNIQNRYTSVTEQNKYYTNHLDKLINKM